MLFWLNAAQLVLYIGLLALLGQGVLYIIAGARRESNFVYQLFHVLNGPWGGAGRRARPQPLDRKETTSMQLTESQQRYWQKNLRITGILLAIWFVVTFVVGFFARDLSFTFFGWPFSFWVGAQGALVVYVLIIGFYARYMNQLDIEHGVAEQED